MGEIVHKVLWFDRFALDLARGCLRSGDQDIELRPKAFEVLRHLAANAGILVPKQDLYEAVWPNVAVSDELSGAVHPRAATEARRSRAPFDQDGVTPRLFARCYPEDPPAFANRQAGWVCSVAPGLPGPEATRPTAKTDGECRRAVPAHARNAMARMGCGGLNPRVCRRGGCVSARARQDAGRQRWSARYQVSCDLTGRVLAAFQIQGLQRLPGDGRAASRRVHDGCARGRSWPQADRRAATACSHRQALCAREVRGHDRSVFGLCLRNRSCGGQQVPHAHTDRR